MIDQDIKTSMTHYEIILEKGFIDIAGIYKLPTDPQLGGIICYNS